MTAKKYEYNGKKKTVADWSRETGIASGTITDRLKNGWEVSTALTTPADQSANFPTGAGRQLKESFLSIALKAYKRNESACEEALDLAFQTDPLKTMKDLAYYLPKDAIERAVNNTEKAIVRIELAQPPQRIEYIDVTTHEK